MDSKDKIDTLFFSLHEMPDQVMHLLQLFEKEDLSWKPESWEGNPGENFSAIEQICHLRDIEIEGYHNRIAAIRKADEPVLASIDGYELSRTKQYANTELINAWQDFANARNKTITILEGVQENEWDLIGDFNGKINLTGLIHILCSHDMEHLASLRWLLAKLEGKKAEATLDNSF